MSEVDLTIVMPVLNEREALPGLLEEIEQAANEAGWAYEVLVVDDGSTDGTFDLIENLATERPWLRGIKLRSNFGKSKALATGFAQSRGRQVVTIDGDGQDDPADIPALLELVDQGMDLVSGWKRDRKDPWTRRLASRFFNGVTAKASGVPMHDMNSGLKAYNGRCARSLELYGEMHRFIPVLASQQGWTVAELPANHRPRVHGSSKFGLERYLRGALDLLTVMFLGRYQNRPLHLFGAIGMTLTVAGVAISVYLTALKISGASIGDRPLLFLGVLLIVVGIQLLSLGLLGQMLVLMGRERSGPSADDPQIERVVDGGRLRSAKGTTSPREPAPSGSGSGP